jgi:hypothetical protein
MGKEFYDISYKTYFNFRINQVRFQGEESWPLYVQMTYDRKTIFFKSYYFDLFARSKFDFLRMPIIQVDQLERRVIDFIIARYADRWYLDEVPRQYKVYCQDVLELCEPRLKLWLASYFREEKMAGLAAMVEQTQSGVAVLQVWDSLKKIMDDGSFLKMEEKAARFGGPYLPLATYIRHKYPKGPLCLPLHEWLDGEKQIAMENFTDGRFWRVDFGQLIGYVQGLVKIPANL